MRIIKAESHGAATYITDLKIRVGEDGSIVSVMDAIGSSDLRYALEQGMVLLSVTKAESDDPQVTDLLMFAKQAAARREGLLLFAAAESAIRSRTSITPEVTIRRAFFRPV